MYASLYRQDTSEGKPVGVTLKIAGVHWWYRTQAHAAELTAGYFNAGGRDGYRDIIQLCAKYSAAFTLTCIEMCDSQHPPEALCGPEGLLRQVLFLLPCYCVQGMSVFNGTAEDHCI